MEALNKNILLAGEVVAERWKVVEKIGEGTFSQIYLAFSLSDNRRVAVKVEAPSALKPVLEWESSILKSLQDCDHVCRYLYHGKHAESTVLVMELLGESMSMLRVSPDAIHGVPLARCVAVGLEMLDCIEAFHRHGYVHRDIKASNFAMSDSPNPAKRKYYIIDFGLSRQHLAEDKSVIPARAQAEFRGTSMYASLSSHRRQELGPKDDLWSWFYLVMDFMRGELPWATDAQKKNRQTVLTLKEYYTEKCPSLLVEGLIGASHLVAIMKYLQSLKYEDEPDYDLLRQKLKRVETGSKEEDTMELWTAIESERERALQWCMRAKDAVAKNASNSILETLLSVARKFDTFFGVADLNAEERVEVQEAVYDIETKLRAVAQALAPPPIQSFVKRRLSEQKGRSDALRRRRERDFQIRQALEQKARRLSRNGSFGQSGDSPANGIQNPNETPRSFEFAGVIEHKSEDSAMEMSDGEETATPPQAQNAPIPVEVGSSSGSAVRQQPPPAPPVPHRWPTTISQPFTSSPRLPPPLPHGPPNGHYHAQPPLPPGPRYVQNGAAFMPPLPPPLPPGYSVPQSGHGWVSEPPEHRSSGSYDRNGNSSYQRSEPVSQDRRGHDRTNERDYDHDRERESSHRERSRPSRRSHSRDRKHKHRSSRQRSVSRSSSRSRSPSRSRSRSRSTSESPVRSGRSRHRRSRSRRHRSRSRSSSSSESRSRSPRRRRSRSKDYRSSSRRKSSGDESRRSRSRDRYYADEQQQSSRSREERSRRPSRWHPK